MRYSTFIRHSEKMLNDSRVFIRKMMYNEASAFRRNRMALLSGKPIWVSWIFFTVLSGLIFGVSYTLIYFIALKWWIAALVIIAVGIIWGTAVHKRQARIDAVEGEAGSGA